MEPLRVEDLGGIQGDILLNGFPKKAEIFCFFTIRASQKFCETIQKVASSNIASGKDIKALRDDINKDKSKVIDVAKTNIAFTSKGLSKLGNVQTSFQSGLAGLKGSAPSFFGGMQSDSERQALGDPVFSNWNLDKNGGGSLDGVLIVAGAVMSTVEAELKNVLRLLNAGDEVVVELGREVGKERETEKGHEHFGFNDGISHPQVIGINDALKPFDDVTQPAGNINFVQPGVIVVGRQGDRPRNARPQALSAFGQPSFETLTAKPKWMQDGSFLVFRKLEQHVGAWKTFTQKNFDAAGCTTPEHLGAKLMGRWQSGCPVVVKDQQDDTTLSLKNDFDYNSADANAKCPMAAHIRKAHIRDIQADATGSTRIMRRGIPYGEDWKQGGADSGRGLLFAAYQSTIEDGYRFIQTAWANKPSFPSLGAGFDVTIGQGKAKDSADFSVGSKKVTINPLNEFVTTIGGEYFFAPSVDVLKAGFNLDKLSKGPQAKI
ncbi:hypothetical protein N0V94_005002 [Neodidymelliopsis sp. IMI 364377]|nr:hypothetical protein N0V94_005002 [Neodidymelliopsis sp. IMI 364377]